MGIIIFIFLTLVFLMTVSYSEFKKIDLTAKHVHVLHYLYSGDHKSNIHDIQILGANDEIFKIVSALVCMIEKNSQRNVIYWLDESFG